MAIPSFTITDEKTTELPGKSGQTSKPPRTIPDITALADVPQEMRRARRWVTWKYKRADGKWTKMPRSYRGGRGASTDPATWGMFDEAWSTYLRDPSLAGIGFVLGDGWAGIDHDDCIDDGAVSDFAQETVRRAKSYTEISPSLNGIKIFIHAATLPWDRCKDGPNEIYVTDRFFTLTGRKLPDVPSEVREAQDVLNWHHHRVFGPEPTEQSTPKKSVPTRDQFPGDDADLIAKAKSARNGPAFSRLWTGDTTGHAGDDSAADLALCNLLAFWTGGNADRIDRLFRQSGLMRPKWDERRGEKTYGELTIDKAIQGCREFCKHNGHNGKSNHKRDQTSDRMAEIARLMTDVGNAARLTMRFGQDMRYCYPRGQWIIWTGKRYEWDMSGRAIAMAKQTVLAIFDEAQAEARFAAEAQASGDEQGAAKHADLSSALAKWAVASQRRERIAAMLALAQPDLAISPDDLDADPLLLNCDNGTIDLRTGDLRPHRREDFITKICRASYRPDATAREFKKFLARIFCTHPALIEFIQRAIGYGATGLTCEQVLLFLFGRGAKPHKPTGWHIEFDGGRVANT